MITHTFLSLGGGVQSSTLALMSAYRDKVGRLDGAIFADTQAEPQRVYDWLDYLEEQIKKAPHPFPVYRVTEGNLTNETLKVRHVQTDGRMYPKGTPYMNKLIPMFGLNSSGKRVAALGRKCTDHFKIRPVLRQARWLAHVRYGTKEPVVVQWIGISYDEMQRMKESREPWVKHAWPLVDLKMRREDCLRWMKEHGFNEPPRSACYYCPFHSDEEWINMKQNDQESWQKAVEFDRELRSKFLAEDKMLKMKVFLHSTCKPLDEVALGGSMGDQLEWNMQAECAGMCGV